MKSCRIWAWAFALATLLHVPLAQAENRAPISDTQGFGAQALGEEIGRWLLELQPRPRSLSIVEVRETAPLTPQFSTLLETEILARLARAEGLKAIACLPCRSPRASVVRDQVVISRGLPAVDELRKLAQELQVDSFLLIEANRTATSIWAAARLFASSGEVLASKSFSEAVLDIDGGSAMLGFLGAIGAQVGGRASKDDTPSGAATIFFLQDTGNGRKAGLAVGGFAGGGGGGGFAEPTMGWLHRRALFGLDSMLMAGLGAGFSTKGYGLALRGSYQLFLGYCSFGLEATGLVPFSTKPDKKKAADGVVGFNIGFVLGR